MPDARGNFKGVALGGKAGETWDRIFGPGGLEEQQRRYEETGQAGAYFALDRMPYPHNHLVRVDPAPEGAGSDEQD